MSTSLRVALVAILWVALGAGYVTDDRSYFGIGVGIGLVLVADMVERFLRHVRTRRP